MSKEIKNEFKEFISTLSTEICKEVLLDELSKINISLNSTSNKYNELYINYESSINKIKDELSKLDNANNNMNNFTNSINSNSKAITEALDMINKDQKMAFDEIIKKNSSALSTYKTDIQKINKIERDEFIRALKTNINDHSKKYTEELSKLVNGSKMNQTLSNTEEINSSIESLNQKANSLDGRITKIYKDIIKDNEEKYKKLDKNITKISLDTSTELKKDISVSKDELSNNIRSIEKSLKEEFDSKYKVIIGLNIAILIMLIVIFFIK